MPRVDLALVMVGLAVFGALAVLHLALRPELRNGRKPSRMLAYAIGTGVLFAGLLALEFWRGLAAGTWLVGVFQLWLDAAVIALAGVLATGLPRLIYGEPVRSPSPPAPLPGGEGSVERAAALASIERAAKELRSG